eukprot:775144-Pelagomonas_calceolata.AAC.4
MPKEGMQRVGQCFSNENAQHIMALRVLNGECAPQACAAHCGSVRAKGENNVRRLGLFGRMRAEHIIALCLLKGDL